MYKWIYHFKFKRPQRHYKPVILITGCSSGIGLAVVQELAKYGWYRIIATSREESFLTMKNLLGGLSHVYFKSLDVTQKEELEFVVKEIEMEFGQVDILINNAGICYRSSVEDMDDADEWLQIQTNYLGPLKLIRLVLPKMRQIGRGKIINISSVSGMLAMPTMSSYSASKHALEGASEALWYECQAYGVNVSLIQPGFVKSKSFERICFSKKAKKSMLYGGVYADLYHNMESFIARLMNHGLATPESIAQLVFNVVRTQDPPLWIPASFDAEFFYYLRRFFPRRLLQPLLFWCLPSSNSWGKDFSRKRKSHIWPIQILVNRWQRFQDFLFK